MNELEQLRQDLAVLDQAMGIQIGLLNEFTRSDKTTPVQKVLIQDYKVAMLQIQHDLFCEALQDKIDNAERDIITGTNSCPSSPRTTITPILNKSKSFLFKSPRRYTYPK